MVCALFPSIINIIIPEWISHLGRGAIDGHGMQHLVEKLQCTVQMHFNPAGRLLDRLSRVIRTPALDKAQSQYAQATQIVHTDASSSCDTCKEETRLISTIAGLRCYSLLPVPPICWLATPATAAACAAAAACALVASECIC